jgi:signal transduction histidine kinase
MSDRAGLLKNAVYYAQPIRVTVSLEGCAAQLDIQVQDDGKGFNATDASMSLGPLSMREIARTVGYKVLIDSSLGNSARTRVPAGAESVERAGVAAIVVDSVFCRL